MNDPAKPSPRSLATRYFLRRGLCGALGAGGQLVQVLPDLLRGQARQALVRRQAGQAFLRRQRLEDFPALLRRKAFEAPPLLLWGQLRKVFLGVLPIEVFHRERHGKALPTQSHEQLPE